MTSTLLKQISTQLEDLQQEGFFKTEHVLSSPQQASVKTQENRELLNFCANNYLGLSNHPQLVKEASNALERYGFGMSLFEPLETCFPPTASNAGFALAP